VFLRLSVVDGFSSDEVERARRYHRPLYVLLGVNALLALAVPAALLPVDLPLPWWAEIVAGPALVFVCAWLAGLPLAWWRLRHERAWEFSTQTTRGWWADRARSLGIGLVVSVVSVGGLLALAHLFPRSWAWPAAAVGAGLALAVSFVAPVVLEPLFNRFRPLEGELADRLRATSERAGVPVRRVLVADASRRTRKQNAYVSGLGRTRRVVLWDTLLDAPPDAVELVVAHELGHRKLRHVLLGTILAMAGAVGGVVVLRVLRPRPEPSDAAFVILVANLLELATLPFLTAVSRRWERAADRFSLLLVPRWDVFEGLQRRLARANLADLEPPKWLYRAVFTHPTPPERLRDARVVLDRLHQ
jgi:Zn-dependent protease with chaperone function